MNTEKNIKIGRQAALSSFLFGTLIFGLYFLTSSFMMLIVGYGFIAFVGLINIGVLISILLTITKDKYNIKRLLGTCGLMLLNIPIMILYCWLAIILLNTLRITFTNCTQTNLTEINIVGCETEHLDKLEIGESKTVWVGITGDCTININYLENGQRKEENLAGYVTSSMGQKMDFKIGVPNEILF